ncbi:MAG TPA: FtsW/RodA/SpoVE family cell cycle protein [Candidatus Paceibacterota bacterium]|nr:FtsW/RodA/SpoVE family cell cycle protein [Candidatus Paceibacterota bacterium]
MVRRNASRGSKGLVTALAGYLRTVDIPLLAGTVVLCVAGVLNLWGVGGADHVLVKRQVIFVAAGLGLMVACSFLNWRYLKNWSLPVMLVYGVAVVLLALTLAFPEIRGIRAWIVLGWFRLEPSELAKLALVVLLAKYFSARHAHIGQLRHIIVSGIYFAVPTGIILIQPDLGSAGILVLIWGAMLLSAGISRRHLFALLALAVIGSYLAWVYALAPYQQERILAFIDPYQDPTGYGYHIIQSRIAIGSGHIWGQGLGDGSQAQLGFLPEPYNDFAFAAFAEQLGIAGIAVLLGASALVGYRILVIGRNASNNFSRLFCIGIATIFLAHVIVSSSVNLGLMPITGLPFSFLSYGGSHLFALMIGIGTVQSMKRYA